MVVVVVVVVKMVVVVVAMIVVVVVVVVVAHTHNRKAHNINPARKKKESPLKHTHTPNNPHAKNHTTITPRQKKRLPT